MCVCVSVWVGVSVWMCLDVVYLARVELVVVNTFELCVGDSFSQHWKVGEVSRKQGEVF